MNFFFYQKGEKGEFLQMFYKRAMQTLCAPIVENAKDGKPICGIFKIFIWPNLNTIFINILDSYYIANKIALVVDLLCFFVEHHSYNMRTYIIQKGLIQQVLVYLKSKHHFLAHCKQFYCKNLSTVYIIFCSRRIEVIEANHWPLRWHLYSPHLWSVNTGFGCWMFYCKWHTLQFVEFIPDWAVWIHPNGIFRFFWIT